MGDGLAGPGKPDARSLVQLTSQAANIAIKLDFTIFPILNSQQGWQRIKDQSVLNK